jgi:hypothetical protein
MRNTLKYSKLQIGFLLLLFAGCFLFFGIFFKYHIWFSEQMQVFLLTFSYFSGYLAKPAFLSCWTGDFLIQFYWLNWGGAIVNTLTLVAMWALLTSLFNRMGRSKVPFILPLLPVITSFIALCYLEYPVSNSIALILSVLISLGYISIRPGIFRVVAGTVFVVVLYLAAGSSFWIFTAVVLFTEFAVNEKRGNLQGVIYVLLITSVSVIVPLALKNGYLLTPVQAFTYTSEMTRELRFFNILPLLSVIIILPALLIDRGKTKPLLKPSASDLLQIIITSALLIAGILLNADFQLERIFRLDFEARMNRWDNVCKLSDKYGMKNNISSYYTNMALSNLGIMPEKLMDFYQPAATGLFIPVNANENYLSITFSNEIYWQLGDVNASQHSALLGTIFSPRAQNSRLMKRIVEINIVNSQYAVADKYLRILEKTMFHRKWALEMKKYLWNEDECLRSGWIQAKRALIPSHDLLKSRDEYITTLRMLADNNPGNRMAIDYLLCFHLLSKDINSFEADFGKYYKPSMDPVLPKVYQEGLLIKIASGEKTPADYSSFRFTPGTVNEMAEYTRAFDAGGGKGSALLEKFGKSYWFYYHFATMKTE